MSHRLILARQTLYGALNSVVIQVLAIVTLSAGEYGAFALYYVLFAWMSSLTLSIVCEASIRSGGEVGGIDEWPDYGWTLVALSGLGAVAGLALAGIAGTGLAALPLCAAVVLSTYRVGARFHAVTTSRHSRVGAADIAGTIVALLVFFGLSALLDPLLVLACSWLASAAASVAFSELPNRKTVGSPVRWLTNHSRSIRTLLADSLMLDLGSIAVPIFLAPLLGAAGFGVYRAVSSMAIPVRIMLAPVRPLIARQPHRLLVAGRTLLGMVAIGTCVGLSIGFALSLFGGLDIFEGGVLQRLSEYSVPTAIFVASNFVGTFYYLAARGHLADRSLVVLRAIQLLGAVVGPCAGFVVFGLEGAVWGFSAASVLHAGVLVTFNLKSVQPQNGFDKPQPVVA